MYHDELLFVTFLLYNFYLLTIMYVLYCNYYHVRIIDGYYDIILTSAFLSSIHMYYQFKNRQSNRII